MSKIDEVARVICRGRFPGKAWEKEDVWGHSTPCEKEEYIDIARAAIEAMREPTEKMQVQGGGTLYDKKPSELRAYTTYQAMIDAALNEQ